MRRAGVLGRRRVLGLGLAALFGGGLSLGGRHKPGVRWGRARAWPEARVPLHLAMPPSMERGASLWLEVDGPGGRRRFRLREEGDVVQAGRLEVPLIYPHEGRVAGTYVYRATLEWSDGRRWETPTTVSYRLGRAAWLS